MHLLWLRVRALYANLCRGEVRTLLRFPVTLSLQLTSCLSALPISPCDRCLTRSEPAPKRMQVLSRYNLVDLVEGWQLPSKGEVKICHLSLDPPSRPVWKLFSSRFLPMLSPQTVI